jgi:hypothetical protein
MFRKEWFATVIERPLFLLCLLGESAVKPIVINIKDFFFCELRKKGSTRKFIESLIYSIYKNIDVYHVDNDVIH